MSNTAVDKKNVIIIRHGEALHNVQRGYPYPDPPLTETGLEQASCIQLSLQPDLIVVSPMRRTLQTAFQIRKSYPDVPIEIWPDLREAHDAISNQGSPTSILQQEFPNLDFSECLSEWTYEPHTSCRASERADRVRRRLREHPANRIVCVTHRGFIEYLVLEDQIFRNCEVGYFKFSGNVEAEIQRCGKGENTSEL